jgi:hypothetical protein
VLDQKDLGRCAALVNDHRNRPYHPVPCEKSFEESRHSRGETFPNEEGNAMELRVALDETY